MSSREKAIEFYLRLIGYAFVMGPPVSEHNQLLENVEGVIKNIKLSTYIADLRGIWEENVFEDEAAAIRENFIRNGLFDRSANAGPEGFLSLGDNLVKAMAQWSLFGFCVSELTDQYRESLGI